MIHMPSVIAEPIKWISNIQIHKTWEAQSICNHPSMYYVWKLSNTQTAFSCKYIFFIETTSRHQIQFFSIGLITLFLNKCSSYVAAVDTRKRRVWCKKIKLIRFQLFISVSHECMLIQRARVICTKKGDKALPTIKT